MRRVTNFSQQLVFLLVGLLLACAGCVITVPPERAPETPPALPSLDTTPPQTELISAPSETIDYNNVTLKWTGSDDRTVAADLTYSYYLEGYDADYSTFVSDTSKTYSNLANGSYTFYVKARDTAGNVDPTPATKSFTVAVVSPKEKPEKEKKVPDSSGLVIVPNSEVNRIAVGSDGKAIYALDSVNTRLYKSANGGFGWSNISASIPGAGSWNELAVAPDDPNIVAVVTNGRREVYVSYNGSHFFATGLAGKLGAGELVRCITISLRYGVSSRELAVGTSTGAGGGRVWVSGPMLSGWTDVSTGAAGWLPGVPAILGADVFAVEYSPKFAADRVILAIVASGAAPNTNDTYLYIGVRDFTLNSVKWNGFSGYPVEICNPGGDTPGTPLRYADLALPSDYFGFDGTRRCVYALWSDGPGGSSNDDVYRLDDASVTRLNVTGAQFLGATIAYYGTYDSGKLLAGMQSSAWSSPMPPSVQVYFTPNPQASIPTWKSSLKPPTGRHEAQVAWSPDGEVAYCGTSTIGGASNDQSAFSRSTDNGLSWNQTGLIDT